MNDIFRRLHQDIDFLYDHHRKSDQDDLWSGRMKQSVKKIINSDKSINKQVFEKFRRNHVFISESESYRSLWPHLQFVQLFYNYLLGGRRGHKRFLKERLSVMREENDIDFLEKYPISRVGDPAYVDIEGYQFSKRWSNNIHNLSLFSKHLSNELPSKDTNLIDIGGGYGIFSSLLKHEFKEIRSAVVEFPEQLLLTYFFLSSTFPDAAINTLEEVYSVDKIDREFVERFDFILIPNDCYEKIEGGTFDVVTNFFSFGEMSEEWFEIYTKGNAFRGADYIFTINRFESRPTYNTMLNILDYRLDRYEKIHFQISIEKYYYKSKLLFFYEKEYYTSQFFEFIGKRLT